MGLAAHSNWSMGLNMGDLCQDLPTFTGTLMINHWNWRQTTFSDQFSIFSPTQSRVLTCQGTPLNAPLIWSRSSQRQFCPDAVDKLSESISSNLGVSWTCPTLAGWEFVHNYHHMQPWQFTCCRFPQLLRSWGAGWATLSFWLHILDTPQFLSLHKCDSYVHVKPRH